ncbi:hypothetical protein PV383_19945 [Streptomyces caniscabiei]|uniref:Conjugal transfer protein n=1 Tax=Streptomyces caniscabiei TaxID=2746961 RepID=A0ABU4MTM4_9ACTN|nr:hypothetical protein [Streptomyces caniscabiei]MDX3039433.1 hypothetical protein [Streptomyces caniscabiei]
MNKKLSWGQKTVLVLATLPMIAVGAVGGWGTYTNIVAEFGRAATAAGAVAAGEGVTLVAALVMLVLTMLGQSSPAVVRVFLWLGPLAASTMGVAVADTPTERILYALMPLGMCGAAEGVGLLARRVVVYRTDVDVEAQRRNAAILRKIAYHRARADRHPWKYVRRYSALVAWRLMGQLGHGDATLGSALTDVQNIRVVEGANTALAAMLHTGHELPPATPRHPVAAATATPRTPRATVTAKTVTPPEAEATPAPTAAPEQPVVCYEPGTPQYVVRELWTRLNHQPIQSDIVTALGAAGLANSEQQARKIRSQVRRENPGLPGPRAA